jgi:hypothetical protein
MVTIGSNPINSSNTGNVQTNVACFCLLGEIGKHTSLRTKRTCCNVGSTPTGGTKKLSFPRGEIGKRSSLRSCTNKVVVSSNLTGGTLYFF